MYEQTQNYLYKNPIHLSQLLIRRKSIQKQKVHCFTYGSEKDKPEQSKIFSQTVKKSFPNVTLKCLISSQHKALQTERTPSINSMRERWQSKSCQFCPKSETPEKGQSIPTRKKQDIEMNVKFLRVIRERESKQRENRDEINFARLSILGRQQKMGFVTDKHPKAYVRKRMYKNIKKHHNQTRNALQCSPWEVPLENQLSIDYLH